MHFLELPLVFFTVLAQCAVGGYLMVIAHLNSIPDGKQRRLVAVKTIFFVLAFMTIGFASSTMHLGSPLRAFNSLNRVGGSGLSNEILTGSIFFALTGCYWLTEVCHKSKQRFRSLLRYLAAIAGIIFMAAMVKVYLIETVPLWDNIFTPLDFIFTVMTAGVLFGSLLLNVFGGSNTNANKRMAAFGLLIIGLHFIVIIIRTISFSSIATSIHQATTNLQAYMPMIIIQCVLMLLAGWLWMRAINSEKKQVTMLLSLAFVAIFVAEIFGRGTFYGMHFTVGLL
ncbi:dimethyl sulfoxide reductase anchor subunit family protein [Photobacterium angustum]|uniref:dimethyl sulfoxide reductase anchor subunit family protein n=1 Tax=Photobacterium angustum TaxID=661 RepID=UPI0005E49C47|nr:DmsC/YnfH family molybdoenzyme membrane anchor subunit [Photobacterium angustum]KJG15971.1 dimethyl sulfoxide reductase [Photobacterium angustum]KJG21760.1 dimethyl sulfoxide reductase [Photobacterium angustum]KJG31005.1 dimethyl sulfoxide reductase [Photobacterium angustum]PSW95514.1 dimethyl sulfoxide reductase [Photobacterium angustum]PSX01198.1 dimethyl sulfoxide reductase [Photobacterium angustum]